MKLEAQALATALSGTAEDVKVVLFADDYSMSGFLAASLTGQGYEINPPCRQASLPKG